MAPTPPKRGKGSPKGSPSTPKSAFASGKFTKSDGFMKSKKDGRNLLKQVGLRGGVTLMRFEKFNAEEAIYDGPWKKELDTDPTLMEDLGIQAVVFRKGEDPTEPMPQKEGDEFAWSQMVFIPGEDSNTAVQRETEAMTVIEAFNARAVRPAYKLLIGIVRG